MEYKISEKYSPVGRLMIDEEPRNHGQLPLTSLCSCFVLPGGLSLWLVVWLVLGKPSPASACPHLCVCYPTPMTVSCQAQNFTAVPVGVPYESQRVFLQNNRITELRVGSFGFGTQVRKSVDKRSGRVKLKYSFKHFSHLKLSTINSCICPPQVLWLFSNNITWIEAGAFSELRDLEELDLGDNPNLHRLEGGAFRGLEKLQSLHMHRCRLSALPHDIFHKLYSLQFLYLQVGGSIEYTQMTDTQLDTCTHGTTHTCKPTYTLDHKCPVPGYINLRAPLYFC